MPNCSATAEMVRGGAALEALCFTAHCHQAEGIVIADQLKFDPVALRG